MMVLICLDGYRVAEVLSEVGRALSPEAEWVILHVSDTRPIDEAERALGALPGREAGRGRAEAHLRQAAEWDEDEVRHAAARWLVEAGRTAEIVVTRGRPEREIVRVAEERHADLVVLGGGRGLAGRYPGPGPFPLSPVARFVVDHLQCDLILLRRYVAGEDRAA